MRLLNLLAILAISIFFTACDDGSQTVVKDVPSFKELKEKKNENFYTLRSIDGKEIKIEYKDKILTSKDLNGKIVLLNFFATWCPPCKEEIPILNKIAAKYPDDFTIISVLFQDPIELKDLKKFIKDNNMKFDVIIGDDNAKLAKNVNNIRQIPESYLFAKDGVLIEQFLGVVNEKILIKYIEQLKK